MFNFGNKNKEIVKSNNKILDLLFDVCNIFVKESTSRTKYAHAEQLLRNTAVTGNSSALMIRKKIEEYACDIVRTKDLNPELLTERSSDVLELLTAMVDALPEVSEIGKKECSSLLEDWNLEIKIVDLNIKISALLKGYERIQKGEVTRACIPGNRLGDLDQIKKEMKNCEAEISALIRAANMHGQMAMANEMIEIQNLIKENTPSVSEIKAKLQKANALAYKNARDAAKVEFLQNKYKFN